MINDGHSLWSEAFTQSKSEFPGSNPSNIFLSPSLHDVEVFTLMKQKLKRTRTHLRKKEEEASRQNVVAFTKEVLEPEKPEEARRISRVKTEEK